MSNFNVGKSFNRLTQRAGELVNKNVKTEYPPETVELMKNIDSLKPWLNQLISATEAFVDITAATKVIGTFQKNRQTTTTTDKIGAVMDSIADQAEGAAPAFATALKNTAGLHQSMAAARKSFNDQINSTFIDDLKHFMNNDLDAAIKAKADLEIERLDLDTAKTKFKNAKTPDQQAHFQAEITKEESEFTHAHSNSVAIFKATMKDELSIQLKDLVQAEKDYYDRCAAHCQEFINQH